MEQLMSQAAELSGFFRGNIPLLFIGTAFLLQALGFFLKPRGEGETMTGKSWIIALVHLALFAGVIYFVYANYKFGAALVFLMIFVAARFVIKVLGSILALVYWVFLPGGAVWVICDRFTDNSLSDKVYGRLSSLNADLLIGVSGLVVLKAFLPVASFLIKRHKPDYRFWGWVGAEAFSLLCAGYAVISKNWMPILAAFTVSTVTNMVFGDPGKKDK
jgi:hypothetical protein